MRKIAIFSGSFNPIHIGHVAIANYIAEFTDVDEVWFVVSPHNPLKEVTGLLAEEHRFKMVEIAINQLNLPFKVCDIEFTMPKPSYTIDTLNALSENYPEHEFVLVMGADSIANIERWKNYCDILNNYNVMVYPRLGYNAEDLCKKYNVEYVAAPIIELSATFIREALFTRKNIDAFLPCGVNEYIKKYKLYSNERE